MRIARAWLPLLLWGLPAAAGGCSSASYGDDPAQERYERGNVFFDVGRYAEAIPDYEFAISAREGMKVAYHRLAYSHEALGAESRAVEVLEKLLRVDEYDEYALRHLWRLYVHRGRVEEALEMCRRLSRLYSLDPGLKAEIARLEGLKAGK